MHKETGQSFDCSVSATMILSRCALPDKKIVIMCIYSGSYTRLQVCCNEE
jgi:hypothetical protein